RKRERTREIANLGDVHAAAVAGAGSSAIDESQEVVAAVLGIADIDNGRRIQRGGRSWPRPAARQVAGRGSNTTRRTRNLAPAASGELLARRVVEVVFKEQQTRRAGRGEAGSQRIAGAAGVAYGYGARAGPARHHYRKAGAARTYSSRCHRAARREGDRSIGAGPEAGARERDGLARPDGAVTDSGKGRSRKGHVAAREHQGGGAAAGAGRGRAA
nr:hypothetical protein [Tanacetum cinerariifolium]